MENDPTGQSRSMILDMVLKYQGEGFSATQINAGQCEDFAVEVSTNLSPLLRKRVNVVYTEDFESSDRSSWNWGGTGPGGCEIAPLKSESMDDLARVEGGHCWLVFEGKHYDCESPAGVDSFFDLPFFRRKLNFIKEARLSRGASHRQ